jgi:hypothetical protein
MNIIHSYPREYETQKRKKIANEELSELYAD